MRSNSAASWRIEVKIRYLLPVLLVSVLSPAQTAARLHLKSKVAQERHLPFSSGVLVGNTLYIAGTTGVGPTTKGSVSAEQETRLVMDQIKQVVEQAGMKMDDIVSLQVFCTDLANYDTFNRVYQTYFHGDYPARAFVGVPKLLFGARYEVMGIAVRSGK
jgi:2-iminobutanoate/2-iminopropanoate deaminase